jgi:hypothetical protein
MMNIDEIYTKWDVKLQKHDDKCGDIIWYTTK